MVMLYGFACAFMEIVEVILTKYLGRQVEMDQNMTSLVGIISNLVDGIIGTVCLIVATCVGYGFY